MKYRFQTIGTAAICPCLVGGSVVAQCDPQEAQKIIASDGIEADDFGRSIAADGDWLLIGAPGVDVNGMDYAGAVYVRVLAAGEWIEIDRLEASDASASAYFGFAVDVHGDWAVIGAPIDDGFRGAAYLFQRDDNGVWVEYQKITASNSAPPDRFGQAVSLWEDRLIVGAPSDQDHGLVSGSAYIYEFDGSSWNEVAFLSPDELEEFDIFGECVSICRDFAAVGAQGDDDAAANAGAVYIFERSQGYSGEWSSAQKVVDPDQNAGNAYGFSLVLIPEPAEPEAVIIIAGAPGTDVDGAADAGAAHFYKIESPGQSPEYLDIIVSEKPAPGEELGTRCDGGIFNNGSMLVALGAPNTDSCQISRVVGGQVVESHSTTGSDTTSGDDFGRCVLVSVRSDDQATIFSSSPLDDDNGPDSGSVFTFDAECNEPTRCFTTAAWFNDSSSSGSIDDTCASDDVYWGARRATFTPAVGNLLRLDMSTNVANTSPTSLSISVEASIDNPNVSNVSGQIKLKNQSLGSFRTIATGPLSSTDFIFAGSPPGDPADFVGPNGEVDIQIVFIQTAGGPNWNGLIDHAAFEIE